MTKETDYKGRTWTWINSTTAVVTEGGQHSVAEYGFISPVKYDEYADAEHKARTMTPCPDHS